MKHFLFLILLVFLVYACVPSSQEITARTTTAVAIALTPTLNATSTTTHTSTVTLSPTVTSTPTVTTTPTITPTPLGGGSGLIAFSYDTEKKRKNVNTPYPYQYVEEHEIYLIDTNGTLVKKFYALITSIYNDLAWSADGKYLAFTTYFSDWDMKDVLLYYPKGIFLIDINKDKAERIIDPILLYIYDWRWSPDGKRIAVNTKYGFYLANSDGSDKTQVAEYLVGQFAWSPDSKYIVFAGRLSEVEGYQYYLLNVSLKNITKFTNLHFPSNANFINPNIIWSPSGKWIFMNNSYTLGGLKITFQEDLVDVDKSTVAQNIPVYGFVINPFGKGIFGFLPDDSLVALGTSHRGKFDHIGILRLVGKDRGKWKELPELPWLPSDIKFSPDFQSIAIYKFENESGNLAVFRLADSSIVNLNEPLHQLPGNASPMYSWSPDSRYIVFTSAQKVGYGPRLSIWNIENNQVKNIFIPPLDTYDVRYWNPVWQP